MQLAEAAAALRLFQAGTMAVFALLYTVAVFYEARPLKPQDRRWVAGALAALGWTLAVDFCVSWLVGDVAAFVQAGHAGAVVVLLGVRAASVVVGVLVAYTSWRLWAKPP